MNSQISMRLSLSGKKVLLIVTNRRPTCEIAFCGVMNRIHMQPDRPGEFGAIYLSADIYWPDHREVPDERRLHDLPPRGVEYAFCRLDPGRTPLAKHECHTSRTL